MSDNAAKPHRPYEVGKGKPPIEHRFKKGQSGNPAGRRRENDLLENRMIKELLIECANERIIVTIDGTERKISKKAAIAMAMINDALTGSALQRLRAFRVLYEAGAFEFLPSNARSDAEARRVFLMRLAEEAANEDPREWPGR